MEVVCSCATGQRSLPAVRMLTAAGYTTRNLKNGMSSWQMTGLPVMKDLSD